MQRKTTKPLNKIYIFTLIGLILSGCSNNFTDIQKRYVAQRELCTELAGNQLGVQVEESDSKMAEREQGKEFIRIFSRCMKKGGWKVASVEEQAKAAEE
jgi:hypothetical protein